MSYTIWLITSVVTYCAVTIALSLRLFFVKKASLTEPVTHFVFFLSLFTLPLPVRLIFTQTIEGNVSPLLFEFIDYVPISVFLSTCSLLVFYISYYSNYGSRLASLIPTMWTPRAATKSLFAAAFICLISLYLLSTLSSGLAKLPQFLLLGYGSSAQTVGTGYLAAGFPWLFVANMFIFVAYTISGRRVWLGVGLAALTANIGIELVLGARSMVLYILITFGVYFLLKIKQMNWKSIAALGVVAFIALNVVGITRSSKYESFDDFVQKTISGGANVFSDGNNGLFYTLTIGEFVVPFEALPQMVRSVGFDETPWFGLSYIQSPLFLVPSKIFEERPLPLANWYMERFYGLEGHLNEGRQFFFLAEGYLNFGPLGVVLISMVWGIGWRAWRDWLMRCDFDPGAAMVYALGLGFMFRCMSGMFSSFVAGFTQQSLFIALVGLVIAGARFGLSGRPRGVQTFA